jgi:hypothetical protein
MNFEVNNQVFDSAEDALCHASTVIYLTPAKRREHKAALLAGIAVTVVYGFSQVFIAAIPLKG